MAFVYNQLMSTRQIATSTLWQFGSQLLMAVLSILAAKFVAVALAKELAGYYNSAYGYLQIFAVIADFGLYAVAVREMSRHKEPGKIFGAVLVIRTVVLFLALGSAVLFVWVLPQWRGTPFPMSVSIASLVPFFTILAGTLRAIFQVRYKMHFVFVAEVLQRVLTTGCMAVIVSMGVRLSTDVRMEELFLWIGAAGALLLFLLSLFPAHRLLPVRFCFDRTLITSVLLLAAPYGIAYLGMAFYRQLDVVFISLLRPDFALQNAYYGFAGRVEDMAFLVPTLLLNSTLPILTARLADKQDVRGLLGKTLLLLLVLGSIFFLFSFLWSRPLTLLFTTPAYLSTPDHPGSDAAFRLMALPMFLNGLVLYCFYVFLALHQWRRLIVSFGIGVILSIILNLLLTPLYGFVGAATALVIVHVFLVFLLLPSALRALKPSFTFATFLRWMLFTIILGACLSVTAPFITSAALTAVSGMSAVAFMAGLLWVTGLHHSFIAKTE